MVRFLVTFVVWMVFGNWVYDEVQVSFPSVVPSIDRAIEALSVPTHDQWDKEKIASVVSSLGGAVQQVGHKFSFPELEQVEQALNARGSLRVPSLEGNLQAYSAPLFEGMVFEGELQDTTKARKHR